MGCCCSQMGKSMARSNVNGTEMRFEKRKLPPEDFHVSALEQNKEEELKESKSNRGGESMPGTNTTSNVVSGAPALRSFQTQILEREPPSSPRTILCVPETECQVHNPKGELLEKVRYCLACLRESVKNLKIQEPFRVVEWVPQEILEKFENLELIGEGETAVFFKAVSRSRKEPVALKIIDIERLALESNEEITTLKGESLNSKIISKLQDECNKYQKLTNKHLIRLHDHELSQNKRFLVLELQYAGENLLSWLQRERTDSQESRIMKVFSQLLEALDYMHRKGIFHQGVKSSNVLISSGSKDEMTVLLGDNIGIGIKQALFLKAQKTLDRSTLSSLPPEFLRNEEDCKDNELNPVASRDVWAVGVLLHEMLTGLKPFPVPLEKSILQNNVVISSEIGEDFKTLIEDCLRERPETRPSINQLLHRVQMDRKICLVSFADKSTNHTQLRGLNPERFEIIEAIAKARDGKVYKAFDRQEKRICAIKIIENPANYKENTAVIQKLRSKHEDFHLFLSYYDRFENPINHEVWVLSELAEVNLAQVLAARQKKKEFYSDSEVAFIVSELTKILEEARKSGIYRCLLKLSDILLVRFKKRPAYKIAFGSAGLLSTVQQSIEWKDLNRIDPLYSAPELLSSLEAKNEVSKRIDVFKANVYNLGIIALKLMHLSSKEINTFKKTGEPPEKANKYPNTMKFVEKATEKDPRIRPDFNAFFHILGKMEKKVTNENEAIEGFQSHWIRGLGLWEISQNGEVYMGLKDFKRAGKYFQAGLEEAKRRNLGPKERRYWEEKYQLTSESAQKLSGKSNNSSKADADEVSNRV